MVLMENLKVALIGNPNSGKSSVFNLMTGLRQRVSNFPGVTVENKEGRMQLGNNVEVLVQDFPGLYSMFPNSSDEKLVVEILTNPDSPYYPDLIIYVADITNLERHLLLATQLLDMGFPMIFLLNMIDLAGKEGINVDIQQLKEFLGVQIIEFSSLDPKYLKELKTTLEEFHQNGAQQFTRSGKFLPLSKDENLIAESMCVGENEHCAYRSKIIAHHHKWLTHLSQDEKKKIHELINKTGFNDISGQVRDTMERFRIISGLTDKFLKRNNKEKLTRSEKIDKIITHKIAGPFIFFSIMFVIFQVIFNLATYPMDWIEAGFELFNNTLKSTLPGGWWVDLITDGLLAGLAGILVFVPQIALLFLMVAILEESGYMSRAVFMFDGLMQRFGMNGRSIVSLISSGACAIPAIMSTRTISDWKERMITIMVAPLISCSARIPVFTVLVGFAVPYDTIGGVLNTQGLAFMALYLLGIIAALLSGLCFKMILKSENKSHLLIELPQYRKPILQNIAYTVKEKVWSFVYNAGQVILIISLILWFAASFGPAEKMAYAESSAIELAESKNLSEEETENLIAAKKIESSYAGIIGKTIEPAIAPLGFDWKIGIALLTSFAAREVFVGTMSTIYSIGSEADEMGLRKRMEAEIRPGTGRKVFDVPTSMSLLVFYLFAMQCMSTLAVTRKETNSWKWPAIQFIYMSLLAYFGSLTVYQLLS